MAKITLEVDDRTAAGFQSYIQNVAASDQETKQLTQTHQQLADAVNLLTQQQAQQILATQQQTVAIAENRQGFMEWSNTVVEFTRNVRDATAATANWLEEKIWDRAQWTAAQYGINLTTTALTSLAARAVGVSAPLLAIRAELFLVEKAFEATGKKIVAMEGPSSAAAKRLAAEINSGMSTVEEVVERTGKSMDELGLKVESNADRIGVAFDELERTVSRHAGNIWDAFMAPIPIVEETYTATVEHMEKRFGQFTQFTIENTQAITDSINEWMGLNSEHVREQEKFFENEERLAEVRAEYRKFEQDLQKTVEMRRELAEVSQIASQQELEAARTAERQKREEMIRTGEWTEENRKRHFKILEAFADRELSLEREKARRAAEYEKEMMEAERKFREDHLQWIQKREERAAEQRRKIREEEAEYQKVLDETRKEAVASQQNRNIELIKSRLEREMELEEDFNERRQELITELEKQAILNRAAAETNATEDRIEQARIAARAYQDLLDLELAHKIKVEDEKSKAAQKAAQLEIEAERKKIDAIKALRNEQGQNAFESFAGNQSPQKVLEEITRRRLAESRQENPNVGRERRRQLDRQIRQQTLQDARTGKINPGEIARVQGDLAARQILQLNKQGKLAQETMTTLREQAKTFAEQAKVQEEIIQQQREIQEFQRQQQNEARERRGRANAQRRGTRG